MIDSRYPHLQRLSEATQLPREERDRAAAIAEEVCRRTFTSCAWNADTQSLFFYYGTVEAPAFAFPFRVERDGVLPITRSDIEDMVTLIRMGQLPRDEKEEISAQNRAKEEYERAKEQERLHADVRPDAKSYAAYLLRKRRGVARVISA